MENKNQWPKALRLRKNEDFNRVYRKGSASFNRDFQIVGCKNALSCSRYGISLSKKFGKAHERNRMKRQVKEIIRQNKTAFPKGYDFVILPRQKSKGKDYAWLEKSLFHCLSFWSPKDKAPSQNKTIKA